MRASAHAEGLTSLISYAPPVLSHNQLITSAHHNQSEPLSQPHRGVSPDLEVVSANYNLAPTPRDSHNRLRSPPPARKQQPVDLAPIRRPRPSTGSRNEQAKCQNESKGGGDDVPKYKAVSNPLKKKKTVAFGKTVNVSQTVESSKPKKKCTFAHRGRSVRTMSDDKDSVKEKMDTLEKKMDEMKEIVENGETRMTTMEQRQTERDAQMVELTEIVKKLMKSSSPQRENEQRVLGPISSNVDRSPKLQIFAGKENIPSWYHENESNKTAKEKETAKNNDEEQLRTMMLRKWEQNEAFRRHVQQGLLKFGGDSSLDVFATTTNRRRAMSPEYETRHDYGDERGESSMLKTTKVTRQMTVEHIEARRESPARSNALSMDSKKYLARHGISGIADEEDDEYGDENKGAFGVTPLESVYEPGRSVTYYPYRGKGQSPDNTRLIRTRPPARRVDEHHEDYDTHRRQHPRFARNWEVEEVESDELLNEPIDLDDEEYRTQRGPNATYTYGNARNDRHNRYEARKADRRGNRTFD